MKILRKTKYTLFILFVICLMAVFYLTTRGLPSAAVRKIEPHLQFGNMVLSLEKIKLSIFEGIVATGVKYYKKGDIGEPVLQAERVVLKLSPLAWIKGERGISGIIIKNGRTQFSPPGDAGCRIVLNNIYADTLFDCQASLKIINFATTCEKLKISGRGIIILPSEKAVSLEVQKDESADATDIELNNSNLRKILEWLKTFSGNNTVNLDVDFFVDPAHLEKLAVKANMHGRNLLVFDSTINALSLNLSVAGRTASGVFALTEAEIEKIPIQSANGNLQFDEKGMLNVSLKSAIGKNFKTGPAELVLNYDSISNKFAGSAAAGCDLKVFVPLLRSQKLKLADIFSDFDFKRSPPSSEISFSGELKPAFLCRLKGTVLADTFSYKKVPGLLVKVGFDAALDEQDEKVLIQPLLIVRDEGMVRGQFIYDSDGEIIKFSGMSTVDPKSAAAMIDSELASVLDPYGFHGLCQVTAFGMVGFTNSAPNDAEINFNASDVRWKFLAFSSCALNLYIQERNYLIEDLKGSIYNGSINGSISIDPIVDSTNMQFILSVTADGVDFGKLVNNLAGKQIERDYAGTCSASVNLKGLCEDAARSSIKGDGWVKIENGKIFIVPIFSGLFNMIGKVVPGLGMLADKNSAQASFTVENGKVHSSNIFIAGNVISLRGSGDIYFDGRLDLKVQISFMSRQNLLGNLIHLVTMPITKAFEFHLGGTVSNPQWNAVYLPF